MSDCVQRALALLPPAPGAGAQGQRLRSPSRSLAQRAAFSGAQAPSSGSRGSSRGVGSRGLSPQPCPGLCYGLLLPAPGSPPAPGCDACAQWSLRLQCLAECSSKHSPLSGCPLTPHPSQPGEVMKHRTPIWVGNTCKLLRNSESHLCSRFPESEVLEGASIPQSVQSAFWAILEQTKVCKALF